MDHKFVLIGIVVAVWVVANMSVGFDKKDALSMMKARLHRGWHFLAFVAVALILLFG